MDGGEETADRTRPYDTTRPEMRYLTTMMDSVFGLYPFVPSFVPTCDRVGIVFVSFSFSYSLDVMCLAWQL